jgi:predicted metal-dependent peptidase
MTQLIDMVKDERYILESFYDLHFICLWKRFELNAKCLFIYYLIKLLCNHEIYHVIYKHQTRKFLETLTLGSHVIS